MNSWSAQYSYPSGKKKNRTTKENSSCSSEGCYRMYKECCCAVPPPPFKAHFHNSVTSCGTFKRPWKRCKVTYLPLLYCIWSTKDRLITAWMPCYFRSSLFPSICLWDAACHRARIMYACCTHLFTVVIHIQILTWLCGFIVFLRVFIDRLSW